MLKLAPGLVRAKRGAIAKQPASTALTRVVYTSRAVDPLLEPALVALAQAAASRNHAEHVTGVMLYDDSRIYQWLEGPTAAVDRVLLSIHQDVRHADMRVVGHLPIERRSFGAWDMQLATRRIDGGPIGAGEVTRPSVGLVDALRSQPDDVAQLLGGLSCPASTSTVDLVRDLFLNQIMPELAAKHRIGSAATPMIHHRLPELVAYLSSADLDATTSLLATERLALPGSRAAEAFFAALVEPAARRLGDLWSQDHLTALDVTAGLACLRTGLRQVARVTVPVQPEALRNRRILSAALPFEMHAIGHVMHPLLLASTAADAQGGAPRPSDALLACLSDGYFDVLDLSFSAAFTEPERFPDARDFIAEARRASRNPALAVVVSGRAANMGLAMPLHADAVSRSAHDLPRAIERASLARLAA